ncbi:hypothetical protein [Micromonospora sp. WMMD812]|uniref:hypothetical protein n=1 Tax=Micromonospora sp. WMMD812 TaxID=3015152 RepID=UPI00248CD3C6|nr:hypothetical protein [Micromonospora sp. WMMD812]WBB67078.1 hypothetical protein O7603_28845 [Micromonospora sp. WMMD812]
MVRLLDSTLFTMDDLLIQFIGTARAEHSIHYTVSSPGSAHEGRFTNAMCSSNGAYRKVFDVACTSGAPVIFSAQAAFATGDISGVVMMSLPGGPSSQASPLSASCRRPSRRTSPPRPRRR